MDTPPLLVCPYCALAILLCCANRQNKKGQCVSLPLALFLLKLCAHDKVF